MFDALMQRIADQSAQLGIVGLGYVGVPIMLAYANNGYRVLGFDVDPEKIEAISEGSSLIRHIPSSEIARLRDAGMIEGVGDFARLAEVDAIIICVPTPLNRYREPDLSYITATAETVAEHLRPGQLVSLESTTYPGTTREVLRPVLEKRGLRSGVDFLLAYSPEREDPGNPVYGMSAIPKVIGGDGEEALRVARALYDQAVDLTVPVSSPETAEAVKLTENIFRAVNVGLVNELKVVFEAMGIDIWEVIDAAKTKPFGFMPFYPGPGLGGHCIPIDPFYLTWKAREFELPTRFIELAGEINSAMPRHVVQRLALALDDKFSRGLSGARVLIVGVAYKKNVDDMRESPSLKVWDLLEARSANVDYHDPMIPVIPHTREHDHLAGRRSVELAAADYDAVLLLTDHDDVDYERLAGESRLVVDTRNAMRQARGDLENVVKA